MLINFDGGVVNKRAIWSFVVCEEDGVQEHISVQKGKVNKSLQQTNNVAEWLGLIYSLQYISNRIEFEEDNLTSYHIYGDSQLVVKQFNKEYAVVKDHLKPLFGIARSIFQDITSKGISITVNWCPREENALADSVGKIWDQ